MSVATTTPFELFAVCAELTEWSQQAGLPGDYGRLWRKLEAVFRRILAPAPRRGAGPSHQLRHLELELWVDTLHRTLRAEILGRVAASFASVCGSAHWMSLEPERLRQVARAREARARSAESSFISALSRFQRSPSSGYLAEAVRALEEVVETRSPRTEPSVEQESQALERLADVIVEEIPSVAREVLALEVEELFATRVDRSLLDDVSMPRRRFGQDDVWMPMWEEFGSSHSQVEPSGQWFVAEVQARYEDRRLAREVEQAHAEAEAEDRRRGNQIAEECRRREEGRLAAEERKRLELAAQRSEDDRVRFMEWANEQARNTVRSELEVQGLTLKSIPEPQRSAMIREAKEALIHRWKE
jgi:hypothetical protein